MTTAFDEDAWRTWLTDQRAEKDEFFADHPQSPIPPERRDEFDGLSYYALDPDYRVQATIDRSENPQSVQLETTHGRTVTYRRVAVLRFALAGEERSLDALHQDGEDELFVPFSDETTGPETYDGGRYLDLDVDPTDLVDRETIVVDFNRAYSPFCAYSETFDCPKPPEENHLDLPIEAGER
jgi:hypothetical protein